MTELEKLKLLLDIPAPDKTKDDLLALLLEQARGYLLSYCRIRFINEEMVPTVISMAAEDFGRMGGEGVSYRTVSGASEGYRGEYSPRIMAQLRRFRKPGYPIC